MKNLFLLLVIIFCFISNQPISLSDKEFVILYFCDMNGNYEFDSDGRKGLATISELKKQELKRLHDHRGEVFLISGGNFSGKGDNMKIHFSLLNKAGFDAVFIGEEELVYLEQNPTLKNLKLPLIVNRENEFKAKKEKHIMKEGIHFRISNMLSLVEDTKVDVQLLFHTEGSFDYLYSSQFEKPIYLFLNKFNLEENEANLLTSNSKESKNSSFFSFKKNIYTVQCPGPEKVGRLNLYFRKNILIRQRQEFIPLNTKEGNNSWIEPDREIVNELE